MDVNRKGIIRSNKSANNKLGRRVSYSDGISYDRGGGVKQEDKPEGDEIIGISYTVYAKSLHEKY